MNNDLEQFSEEYLKELINSPADELTVALARIALAAKQAKPVGVFYPTAFYIKGQYKLFTIDEAEHSGLIRNGILNESYSYMYTTPQPVHTEQVIPDGWKLVPIEPTEAMKKAYYDSSLAPISKLSATGYRSLIAAAPKPDGTLISEGAKSDCCQWNPDEYSVYSTGCGNEWQFTEGGIEDNKIKFCPYCSGKIAAPKPESE